MRDRNHPLVISYSIGNGIPESGGASDGAECRRSSFRTVGFAAAVCVAADVCMHGEKRINSKIILDFFHQRRYNIL